MIKQIAPDLPSEDHRRRRLVRFARGFPQMANLLGQAWLKDSTVATATDDELFDRIILGRKPSDGGLLKDVGMLVGAFRLLGIRDNLKDLTYGSRLKLPRQKTMSETHSGMREVIAAA
jgi:hypothetical protein